jgi:signal peptidase I
MDAYVMPTSSMMPTIAPGDRFTVAKLITPRRWDLIAYWNNDKAPVQMAYCKRLLGLPGEHIKFQDGNLYVNDEKMQAPSVTTGRYHASSAGSKYFRYRDGETIDLASDEIFLVGDNVDQSKDSRFDGPTKVSDIVGTADVIYWPLNRLRLLR